MRKVTQNAINAFNAGGMMSEGNTTVTNGLMYLHGRLIARWNDQGKLEISDGGYCVSRTTAERLRNLKGVDLVIKDLCWVLNGKSWDGSFKVIQ